MIEKQIAYQRPLSIVEIVATLAKVSGSHVANAIAASQGCLSSSGNHLLRGLGRRCRERSGPNDCSISAQMSLHRSQSARLP